VLPTALAACFNACRCCYDGYGGWCRLRGHLPRLIVGHIAADRCAGSSACSATDYGTRLATGVLSNRGACTTADSATDHGAGTALRCRPAERAANGTAHHRTFLAANFLADGGTSGPAYGAADGASDDRIRCKAHAREPERGDDYDRLGIFHEVLPEHRQNTAKSFVTASKNVTTEAPPVWPDASAGLDNSRARR
jgi:hypothetical protein